MLDERVVSQTFGAFMAVYRSDLNPYLQYFFQSTAFKRQIDEHLGATINQITNGSLNSFEVVLPPSEDRVAIASCLSSVDRLISALERLLAKRHAMKLGIAQQLLTGRTRLAGFGDPWSEVRLGDHVTYVKTVALSRAQLDADSPLRYLHYGDIHTRNSVTLDAFVEPMTRAKAELARTAGHLNVGDLVFADASEDPAGVGKSVEITGVPPEGVVPGLHTIAARFDKSVLVDGYKAYLQFVPGFRNALLRLAAGTKVLATTRTFISSITVELPGADEQRAIARVLNASAAEETVLEAKLKKVREIKLGMMQELLTGRTHLPILEGVA
jgi:type I restriction enzyme S subunit